jgi:hypothetical protein
LDKKSQIFEFKYVFLRIIIIEGNPLGTNGVKVLTKIDLGQLRGLFLSNLILSI